MTSLEAVRKSNSALTSLYGPGLVAVFAGGTSGIGESTARAFVRNTQSSRVYLVGRNETQASAIIEELRRLNPDGQITFVKGDTSLLSGVDEVCRVIQEKEERVNLLFMSQGNAAMKQNVNEEGLDSKLTLHYYARMRFIYNLLPQLTAAGDPSQTQGQVRALSRVISVLEAGGESSALNLSDLSLSHSFSLRNCAKHAITMNSLAMEHLAATHPATSFVHIYPGIVMTGLMRDLGPLSRLAIAGVAKTVARPWVVPVEECGERMLFVGTGLRYPSVLGGAAGGGGGGGGGGGEAVAGSDGVSGSGAYLLNWDGRPRGNEKVMGEFREKGTAGVVWKHTVEVFERIRG